MYSLVIEWEEEITIHNIVNITETKIKMQSFAKKRTWVKVCS